MEKKDRHLFKIKKVASPHFPKEECAPKLGDCHVAGLLTMTEEKVFKIVIAIGGEVG